eukprot:1161567-Pelagomonas_calceolata.AAC.9
MQPSGITAHFSRTGSTCNKDGSTLTLDRHVESKNEKGIKTGRIGWTGSMLRDRMGEKPPVATLAKPGKRA